jgi:hypothetical protein
MPRHRLIVTTALCLLMAILPVSGARGFAPKGNGQEEAGTGPTPRRVVAVGDSHGAFEEFVELMRTTEIVDADLNWIGGNTVLVQTGDFTDRGAGVRQVMDLLMRLQLEAAASGGEVRVALGNHEVMNLIGEVRDVTPEIMFSFASEDAMETREEGFKEFEDRVLKRDSRWSRLSRGQKRDIKDDWIGKHPLGYVEYLRALGPAGEYGRWLRELPFGVIVEDVLFLHAGITPELGDWGVPRLNERVATEIAAYDDYRTWLHDEEQITSFANLTEILGGAADMTQGLDWLTERDEPLGSPPALFGNLNDVGGERLRAKSRSGLRVVEDPEDEA